MELSILFAHLAIALGLGLLVGLQREHAASQLAGIRTFPLITILGVVCAMLAQSFGGWVMAAGFIAVSGLIVVGNIAKFRVGPAAPGLTTEIAMLLMYGVGAYVVVGPEAIAIAIGAGTAVLLQYKGELHGIARKLGDEDLRAVMQFVLISLVILPVLPNQAYGPYAVLNPREIWLMVVLIVGLSLAGYIAYKFFGEHAGLLLGGILGGVISSTATTVSYARRTARDPASSRLASIVIMIASTVMFARVMLEIAVVQASFLAMVWPPFAVLLCVFIAMSGIVWFTGRDVQNSMPVQENPSELRAALLFGLLYAVVLLAVAAAKTHFGDRGLYVVAALSGLTNVDAMTLSTSQLVGTERLDPEQGWRIIVTALMANLFFKAATIAAVGGQVRVDAAAQLQRLFGHESFRPGQQEAVEAAFAGRDALVVMPTGSGKSLCYQLPGLALDGLTVFVISPLVALMRDQGDALAAAGHGAARVLNASLPPVRPSRRSRRSQTAPAASCWWRPSASATRASARRSQGGRSRSSRSTRRTA